MQPKVEGGRVVDYGVFAEGFLDKESDTAWGRPVDVQVMPDGALLVSDDHANAIYRIAREVGERERVVGPRREGALERVLRLVEASLLQPRVAEIIPGTRVRGI